MPAGPLASSARRRPSWWQEGEVLLLALLVGGIYFTRLDLPTLRGEETRWGTCARLHLALGDWSVPRQQGLVFAERPPLGNWLMAAGMLAMGEASPWAVRLPSAIAMLGTTLLVYGYARQFLMRGGALAAATALATMGEAMIIGRMGESEAVFTFLVSASLLLWHWGHSAGWPRLITWCGGFALAGLAGLVKGPQGPVYFVSITGFYLLIVQRNWRALLEPAYLAGWGVFALVVGAWQAAFYAATDLETSIVIWTGLASDRYELNASLLKHIGSFPFEVLISTLPWSAFLFCFLHRGFREQLGAARPYVAFLITAAAIAFLPLWLAAGARTRYFMPVYPCLAVLVGVAIESCWRAAAQPGAWRRAWRRFAWAMAACMVVFGLGVVVVSAVPALREVRFAQDALFATLYGMATLLLAAVLWRAWLRDAAGMDPLVRERAGVLSVAAFLGLTVAGVLLNTLDRSANDIAASVARLKTQLPPDAQLVSFHRTHHLFAWYYGASIPALGWPHTAAEVPAELDYFCFENPGNAAPELPFAWEPIAEVSCERNRRERPHDKVVIGRRLRSEASIARADDEIQR